jgi:hypothetical protein
VVQALLASGADINAKDAQGKTALMRATNNGLSGKVVQFLLATEADKGTASPSQQSGHTTGANQVVTRPGLIGPPPVYWLDPAGRLHSEGLIGVGERGISPYMSYEFGNKACQESGLFVKELKIAKLNVSVSWDEVPTTCQVIVNTPVGTNQGPITIFVPENNSKMEATSNGSFFAVVVGTNEWLLPDFFGHDWRVYKGRIVPYK